MSLREFAKWALFPKYHEAAAYCSALLLVDSPAFPLMFLSFALVVSSSWASVSRGYHRYVSGGGGNIDLALTPSLCSSSISSSSPYLSSTSFFSFCLFLSRLNLRRGLLSLAQTHSIKFAEKLLKPQKGLRLPREPSGQLCRGASGSAFPHSLNSPRLPPGFPGRPTGVKVARCIKRAKNKALGEKFRWGKGE